MHKATALAAGTAVVALAAFLGTAQTTAPKAGFGPNPELPGPQRNLIPTVNIATVFVPFADGRPSGMPEDILTGFLDADGQAQGRPVGVAVDATGALVVADDVGNVVWRVSATAAPGNQGRGTSDSRRRAGGGGA